MRHTPYQSQSVDRPDHIHQCTPLNVVSQFSTNTHSCTQAVPPDGCSALFYACRDGRVAIAEYLLAKGKIPF